MPDRVFERIKKTFGKETEPVDKWRSATKIMVKPMRD